MISNVTRTPVKPSIVFANSVVCKSVLVNTSAYGWRIGIIKRVGVSPYWHEMKRLITRAYVVNQPGEETWSEYVLEEDLVFDFSICTDCGADRPESHLCSFCGCCPDCCECKPEYTPDEEDEDELADRLYRWHIDLATGGAGR